MATLVSDLIQSSFRLLGAVASGETLETQEQTDAFATLNQMLSIWNTEGFSVVARQRMTVTLGSTNSYSLPLRPIKIDAASVSCGGIDSELEIVDAAGWETVPEKAATSVYVKKLYCDYAYPNATAYVAPIPRLSGTLELWAFLPVVQFTSVSQSIDLPPGDEMALRYNLAMALLP